MGLQATIISTSAGDHCRTAELFERNGVKRIRRDVSLTRPSCERMRAPAYAYSSRIVPELTIRTGVKPLRRKDSSTLF